MVHPQSGSPPRHRCGLYTRGTETVAPRVSALATQHASSASAAPAPDASAPDASAAPSDAPSDALGIGSGGSSDAASAAATAASAPSDAPADSMVLVSLVHTHPTNATTVEIELRGAGELLAEAAAWPHRLLTATSGGAFNSEADPDAVVPVGLPAAAVVVHEDDHRGGRRRLRVTLPPRSLVMLELRATRPPPM